MPCSLRALVGRGKLQRLLGAPLDALRTLFQVLALVADFGQLGRRVDGDGTKVASLDTPGTAIAQVGINVDEAGRRVLL